MHYLLRQIKEWWLNISANNAKLMMAILVAITFTLFGAATYLHYTFEEAYGSSSARDFVFVILIVVLPVALLAYWTFKKGK